MRIANHILFCIILIIIALACNAPGVSEAKQQASTVASTSDKTEIETANWVLQNYQNALNIIFPLFPIAQENMKNYSWVITSRILPAFESEFQFSLCKEKSGKIKAYILAAKDDSIYDQLHELKLANLKGTIEGLSPKLLVQKWYITDDNYDRLKELARELESIKISPATPSDYICLDATQYEFWTRAIFNNTHLSLNCAPGHPMIEWAEKARSIIESYMRMQKFKDSIQNNKSAVILHPRLLRSIKENRGTICSIAFSPDGEMLASGSKHKNSISIQAWKTGKEIANYNENNTCPLIKFNKNASLLGFTSSEESVRIWDWHAQKILQNFKCPDVIYGFAFNPKNTLIASVCSNNSVKIFDWKSGKSLQSFNVFSHFPLIVCFNQSGNLLATGDESGIIKLWNWKRGKVKKELKGHIDAINGIIFSPDRNYLFSSSADGTVKAWSLWNGKVIKTLSWHSDIIESQSIISIALNHDGKYLAIAKSDKSIEIWDWRTGTLIGLINTISGPISSIAFNPVSDTLASAHYENGVIELWEVK